MKDSWIKINCILFTHNKNYSDIGNQTRKEVKKLYLPIDSIISIEDFNYKEGVEKVNKFFWNFNLKRESFQIEDRIYYMHDYTKEFHDFFKKIRSIIKTKDNLYYVIETCEELVHQDF